MRIAKIERNSIANGPGVRTVIWCQGCSLHCPGCHNKETWDPDGGDTLKLYDKVKILDSLISPYVDGITFSGGHPLEEYNIQGVFELAEMVREKFHCDKTIWLYTGFELTYSVITSNTVMGYLLRMCDVVVDGPYIEAKKDLRLPYCGSSNQRVIDVKQTLLNKEITLYKEQ